MNKQKDICINSHCNEKAEPMTHFCTMCLQQYWKEGKLTNIVRTVATLPLRFLLKILGL